MHNSPSVGSLLPGPPVRTPRTNQPPEHTKNTGEEPDGRRVMARFIQSKKPLSRLFFLPVNNVSSDCSDHKGRRFPSEGETHRKMIARLAEVSRRRGPSSRQREQKRFLHVLGRASCLSSIRLSAMQIASLNCFFFFFSFQPAKTSGRCLFQLSLASNTSHSQIPFDILQGSMALKGGKLLHTKQTHLDHPVPKRSIFKPLVLNGTNFATTTKKSD